MHALKACPAATRLLWFKGGFTRYQAVLLILTLKLIVMCELKFTNYNNYMQKFLIPKRYRDLEYSRSNESGVFINNISLDNSIGRRIQDYPLAIHTFSSATSAFKIRTPQHQQDNSKNLKKGKRRRRRWSRFDAISDRYRNDEKGLQMPRREAPADEKRNIDIKINAPWPSRAHESDDNIWMKQLLPEIVKGYVKKYGSVSPNKAVETPATSNPIEKGSTNKEEEELVTETPFVKTLKHRLKPEVRSATDCDEWNQKYRTCYFNRNIGDTITFVLTFNNLESDDKVEVHWQQEFYTRNSNSTLLLDISQDDTMWNVVVGSNNREFRISPLTETDFDLNGFIATATIRYPESEPHDPIITKIKFHVRQMAIDMGFVYPGEHLIINVKSFMTLPIECCSFEWYLDRSRNENTLPSNMKVSESGITVEISELRMEQEGILACNVYSNRNVFLTKKRFFIKEFQKDTLMRVLTNRRLERGAGAPHRDVILKRVIRQVVDVTPDTDVTELTPSVLQENLSNEILPSTNVENEPTQNTSSNIISSQDVSVEGMDKVGQGKNISNSMEYVVEMGNVGVKRERIEVRMSKMLEDCVSNRQCSGDATCHQENASGRKFCSCRIGFRGNGLFCWEEAVGTHHKPAVYFVKNEKS